MTEQEYMRHLEFLSECVLTAHKMHQPGGPSIRVTFPSVSGILIQWAAFEPAPWDEVRPSYEIAP